MLSPSIPLEAKHVTEFKRFLAAHPLTEMDLNVDRKDSPASALYFERTFFKCHLWRVESFVEVEYDLLDVLLCRLGKSSLNVNRPLVAIHLLRVRKPLDRMVHRLVFVTIYELYALQVFLPQSCFLQLSLPLKELFAQPIIVFDLLL